MTASDDHQLHIVVNGQPHRVEATPETPLLYVLRNELGLTSPRFGCGLGRCGSCAVLHDGVPLLSCVTPVSDIPGASITTVEGLGTADQPHPVQQAFLDEQAAQCGYCIPGIMITAASLLDRPDTPNRDEIHTALEGHLCRCGAHTRILRAIERAAGGKP